MTYFIFKGKSSDDFGIIVNTLPSIFKPEKDIKKIEIEGRDGYLTQDLGSYRSSVKPVECTIMGIDNIDEICSWLDGSGDVIFSNQPDRIYKATIIDQIEFEKILWQAHKFVINFDCQPGSYDVNPTVISMTSSGTILNSNYMNSKPVLKIYGTGSVTLTINGNNISFTNIPDYLVVDSNIVDCYKDNMPMNNLMTGEFPVFVSGVNSISWTGNISKIEIQPNWRW